MSALIGFHAKLQRPVDTPKSAAWLFLALPTKASAQLPSRGPVAVTGTLNGRPFSATAEPDGQGGHWLKIESKHRRAAGAFGGPGLQVGDSIAVELAPVARGEEPEPDVPSDLQQALNSAAAKAREAWSDITPAARRDFIRWITSGKRAETRVKRIAAACDMLAKGKRRPCCFDRSGMYDKSIRPPGGC